MQKTLSVKQKKVTTYAEQLNLHSAATKNRSVDLFLDGNKT